MPFEYRFPRPALTVDCAVFAPSEGSLDVLLVERDAPPFEGTWATPGGFVDIDEPIAEAAARELAEETGLEDVELSEYGVFGTPGRDPRGRMVSVAFWGLVRRGRYDLGAASDARSLEWFSVSDLPELAFDHDELVGAALEALRARARTGGIGRNLLEAPFSLEEARRLWECVLNRDLATERFRQTLADEVGLLEATRTRNEHPSAEDEVWEFDESVYDRLARRPISALTGSGG